MRICSFIRFLARVDRDSAEVSRHVRRCEACQATLGILARLPAPSPRTDCPEPGVLAAYHAGLLSPDESERLAAHVHTCSNCLHDIWDAQEQLEGLDIDSALAAAERELDAYILAKVIAKWLATEVFPPEAASVDASFEDVYGQVASREHPPYQDSHSTPPALLSLGMDAASGSTLAHRINLLASQIGLHRLSTSASLPAIAELLEQRRAYLSDAGFGGRLLDETLRWLRNQPADSY